MTDTLRILLVEDSPSDAKLVVGELRRLGRPIDCERVEDARSMRDALGGGGWDLVISDWSLPTFGGLAALALVKELGLDLPFIIVTGTIGEERAVDALRSGAHDLILKDNLARLVPAVERELRDRKVRQARQLAEENERKAEERYHVLFESTPLAMLVYDLETLGFLAVNEAACRLYGYSRDEFAAVNLAVIRGPDDVLTVREDVVLRRQFGEGSTRLQRRKDGSIITVEIDGHDVEFEGKQARLLMANDVTDRHRLEEHLRQSQKMEALGRLAGGVAHDFNNVLSVILSYGEFLLNDLKPSEQMYADVEEIRKAGKRAADLTRQLLAFSRQQVIEPKVLDLNEVLTSMDKMLQRILGADVNLVWLPTNPLWRVRADRGNIEQVVMNLVLNARDAMPTGGKLTIETGNLLLDEAHARDRPGVQPGAHVMLAVTDTGTGIDKEMLSRIFEPFFTTKEAGKGTGLGLSTVFGIARQSGGSVWVYSEPGKGTTFKVYLPRVEAPVDVVRSIAPPASVRGSETILLVEDDDQVRAVARGILGKNGYRVIEVRSAAEALLHSEKHPGLIHMLLTDVVMPQMSGPELAKRLSKNRPDMRVLCMSGYTDDSIVRHGVVEARFAYLQKPITPETLTTKVREVLDADR